MLVTIQLRRDTAANWTSVNPVLGQGEIGTETDTGKAKMGTGTAAWTSLPYWQPAPGTFDAAGTSAAETTRAEAAEALLAPASALTAETARAEAAEALKAPLASPALTGTPTAPTATALTSSAQLATTAFTTGAVTAETARAETAEALAAPASALAAETARAEAAEALLAPKASPSFTGIPAAPTATALTSTTQVATTAFTTGAVSTETTRAQTAEALLAPKASPAFTGVPTAPTQTPGDTSTAIATDAFVAAAVIAGSSGGTLAGDVTGAAGTNTVGKIQGVAITAAEAALVSDLNNATARTATATLLPGEETVYSGSTAAQTLTLPASPPASSANTITNAASVAVTLAPGAGAALSNFGTTGNIVIPAGFSFAVVYIGTTWYVQTAGPGDFARSGALSVLAGGTGSVTAAGALANLGAMTASGGGQEVISAATVSAGTYTINLASGNVFNLTLDTSVTFTFTVASSTTACSFTLYVTQGGTGGYAATWPASVTWLGGIAPVLPAAAGAVAVLVFETLNGGAAWTGFTVPSLPLGVINGGIGGTSLNYYGLLAGGTTSTGPVQSVPSGTAGQFLQSAGSGALPVWASAFLTPVALQTASFTLAAGQFAPVSTAAGAVTATFPVAPPNLTMVGLKMTAQTGTNAITLQLGGSDVINVAGGLQTGTISMLDQGAVFIYYAAGAIWYSVANDLPLSQLDLRYPPLTGAAFTGSVAAPDFAPSGLAGATAASRYAGGTASGHPVTGTFVTGDWVVDQTGVIWICQAGGSPGTWGGLSVAAGLAANTFTGNQTAPAFISAGLTGATAASRYAGGTVSGAPASGAFLVGDWVIDQSGKIWVCTVAGSPGTWTNINTGGGGGAGLGGNTFTGAQIGPTFAATGLTGAASSSRYAGATVSGPPASGTFSTGDYVIDQSGTMWVCSAGGSPGTWSCPQAPATNWVPGDNGFLTSSYIPLWLMTAAAAPAAGYILFFRLPVRATMTISDLCIAGSAAAAATTSTGTYAAVISNSGTRLAVSADAGTIFGAAPVNGLFTVPMVTPTLVSPPWVYAAFLWNMTSEPSLFNSNSSGQARNAANSGLTAGSYQYASSASGQTAIGSAITLSGTNNSNAQPYWVGAR